MSRTFIFAPLSDPSEAARAIADSGSFPDLILVAPSPSAHEQAAAAVGGRYVTTVDEPLLARVPPTVVRTRSRSSRRRSVPFRRTPPTGRSCSGSASASSAPTPSSWTRKVSAGSQTISSALYLCHKPQP